MAATATTIADVLKEAWTDDRIQKQFEDETAPWSRIERLDATVIGKQAQVPIYKELAGGYTSVASAGGALNTAGQSAVDQALYTLITHAQPIELELSALNQAESNTQSVISAKNMEIKGALSSMRKQLTRQLVTNGDGIVAQCDTGGASTTVELLASPSGTAYGYDAMVRHWLRPGSVVDIGTAVDTDALVAATTVTAIKESASDPDIVIGSSISTTSGTHFVYIANPNSGTAANPEINGLRNMVNTSGALGGLNPATAGEEFWASPARDTTTSVLSLDLMLDLQQPVMQRSGGLMTDVWSGFKQQRNYYSLLQNQVRFAGEMNMGAGNVAKPTWNGMKLEAFPDILDSDIWFLTLSDLVRVTGNIKSPTWASKIQGGGSGLQWRQGYTSFVDALFYPVQTGMRRRNTSTGATALTA